MRHLISHRLPRRQFGCVIFIFTFYTASIGKRDPGQSFTSFVVCLHSSCANHPVLISFHSPHPPGSMRASGRGTGCRGQLLHVASKTHLQDQHTESRCPDWGDGGVNDCIPPFTICLLERCGVLRRTLGVASKKTHIFLAISCTSLSLSFLINEIKTLTQDLAS